MAPADQVEEIWSGLVSAGLTRLRALAMVAIGSLKAVRLALNPTDENLARIGPELLACCGAILNRLRRSAAICHSRACGCYSGDGARLPGVMKLLASSYPSRAAVTTSLLNMTWHRLFTTDSESKRGKKCHQKGNSSERM